MRGNVVGLWLQKDGSSENEYEDAFAISGASGDEFDLSHHDGSFRVAVADGATESMLAGRWARSLVRRYVAARRSGMRACIHRAIDSWPPSLEEYRAEREASRRPIAWYEEPGIEKGAHATLLVAEFRSDTAKSSGVWSAEAIGDACLFQVRNDELICPFPLSHSSDFGTSPALVHTAIRDRRLLRAHAKSASGEWTSGDSFFLCTDALAAWFLASCENGSHPWEMLREFCSQADLSDFRNWVSEQRLSGGLKNDDVTLLYVQFD